MREILFRGIKRSNRKWIEGTGVLNDGSNTWIIKNKPNTAIKLVRYCFNCGQKLDWSVEE